MDTGVLVAAADRSDPQHRSCAALLESDSGPLISTALVVAECAYLIQRELGSQAETLLYRAIVEGTLVIESLSVGDWARVHELVVQYADLPLGGTDASVVAIAERLGAVRVASLDHRHFSVIRPAHCDAFELVP